MFDCSSVLITQIKYRPFKYNVTSKVTNKGMEGKRFFIGYTGLISFFDLHRRVDVPSMRIS